MSQTACSSPQTLVHVPVGARRSAALRLTQPWCPRRQTAASWEQLKDAPGPQGLQELLQSLGDQGQHRSSAAELPGLRSDLFCLFHPCR